jgi:hypothetical protein
MLGLDWLLDAVPMRKTTWQIGDASSKQQQLNFPKFFERTTRPDAHH